MAQQIQLRHDTAANWTAANSLLMVGEFGYETDTGKIKAGDGSTTWNSLPYISATASRLSGTVAIANGGTGQTTAAAAFSALSPQTTKGDLIVFDTGPNRLAIGSDGQVPVADSTQATGLAWKTLQQGAKNYITYNNFENNSTTGWFLRNTGLSNNVPTSLGLSGFAFDLITISNCTTTNNSPTVTHSATGGFQNIQAGMSVSGSGIPAGTTVLTVNSNTQITLSANYTGAGGPGETLTFNQAASTASFSTVSSGQLAGSYSGSLAFSAASTVGDMLISQSYSLDLEDRAKAMSFKFYFSVSSGAANGNFSGTNANTFSVWIYDIFNRSWIQPAGVYNLVQSSGVGIAQGTFQTPSNMTSFQIAIVNNAATSGALTMLVDDFYVGPQSLAFGPAVSDLRAFTPTATWNSGVTWSGFYKQVGDVAHIEYYGNITGAVTATSLGLNLPSWLTIDTSKIGSTSTDFELKGSGAIVHAGSNDYPIRAYYSSTTQFAVRFHKTESGTNPVNVGSSYPVNNTSPQTFANGDLISFWIEVPIVGWSSNTVMSADSDTRVEKFAASSPAGQTQSASSSNLTVNFGSASTDSHGAWNGSTTYTVPSTGWRTINASVFLTSVVFPAGQYVELHVYKNGSDLGRIDRAPEYTANYDLSLNGSYSAQFNAGDTISIVITPGSSITYSIPADGGLTHISITKASGPAVVAASESVNASYTFAATATGIPNGSVTAVNNTYVTFTKVKDTHNQFNTTSGQYVCPNSGEFRFTVSFPFTANSTGIRLLRIQNGRSGAAYDVDSMAGFTGYDNIMNGSADFNCLAGDPLYFSLFQTSGGALTQAVTAGTIFIERVGN